MADTYYAWSEIQVGTPADESEEKVKKVKQGETVSASSLGIPDEEFESLVESGAIKTEEYPELPEGYTGSPAQYAQEKAAAQAQLDEAQAFLDMNQDDGKTEEEKAEAAAAKPSATKASSKTDSEK